MRTDRINRARTRAALLRRALLAIACLLVAGRAWAPPGYTPIPDAIFEQRLIALGIDSEGGAPDGQVLTSDVASVTSLNVSFAGIDNLAGIEDFTALETLIVTNNDLTSLNVSQNVNLQDLRAGLNDIASLDTSNNPDLIILWVNGNRLTSLDVSTNYALQSLRCQTQQAGFQLTSLTLGAIQNLTELLCQGNNLGPKIDLRSAFALSNVNLTNNPNLTCIAVNNVAAANAGTGIYAGWLKDPTASYASSCPGSADLAITKTDGVTSTIPGGTLTYTIVASNAGPDAVSGATVADTFPAALTCTWTCIGAGGGTCAAAGSGNIADSVSLPVSGSATYTATCTVSATASGTISNTVTIAPPSDTTDPASGNNMATDNDTAIATYPISATASPAGAGTVTCTPNPVTHGATSTCTASPNAGYVFGAFSGDCSGAACVLTNVTAARSVTAGFAPITSHAGPSATGSGTITATMSGGGATCRFSAAEYIPLVGHPRSPPAGSAPPGVLFPQGLFDFTATGCAVGATVAFSITYPQALPPGTKYFKYGPTPTDGAAHWYEMPATIAGDTVTFSITDGGLGDDDLTANGTIVDPGGPGAQAAVPTATPIPTLAAFGLALLSGLILLFAPGGLRTRRRERTAG